MCAHRLLSALLGVRKLLADLLGPVGLGALSKRLGIDAKLCCLFFDFLRGKKLVLSLLNLGLFERLQFRRRSLDADGGFYEPLGRVRLLGLDESARGFLLEGGFEGLADRLLLALRLLLFQAQCLPSFGV